jgi:3-oxoacyl-[acyl-carrier-protein] synthase-3
MTSNSNNHISPYRTHISGTGSYLPVGILSNSDLEKIVDTNDQWISERTGIQRRHIAKPGETTSDLAFEASKKALSEAHLTATDIDLIIFATVSPDQVMPNTACVLQQKLGCRNIPAFDLSAACSGFVYSLSIADQFIRSGIYKHVLVIGAEVLHPLINYKDRETCILFGDAAGAWILSRTHSEAKDIVFSSHLHADGDLGDLFVLPAGGSKIPFSQEVLDNDLQYVKMKGREIFRHAVRTLSQCCKEALEANHVAAEQVDWLVPHQANIRILDSVADHFGIPKEKVIVSLEETGNTSAASIPVAFDLAKQQGKIKRGDLILLAAFGAGLTSGSALLRY